MITEIMCDHKLTFLDPDTADEKRLFHFMDRSLEAPMDRDWADIYTHVSCSTLESWFGEDHWGKVDAPRKLSEWLSSQLNDLRIRIYNKRRELLKRKIKSKEE